MRSPSDAVDRPDLTQPPAAAPRRRLSLAALPAYAAAVESACLSLGAIAVALLLFGVFVALGGHDPIAVYKALYVGGFGTRFSIEGTLTQASPIILTALCTAVPARVGLLVIGGEGALVLGGLAAVLCATAVAAAPGPIGALVALLGGVCVGALWIAAVGALKHWRGVNETISSLLLNYIAIAIFNHLVEGPLKDPASLNKPSTAPLPEAVMIGRFLGLDVHWGLGFGVIAGVLLYVLVGHTTTGFALRIVGGNTRAARLAGLPVGALVLLACALGGAAAGLAGMVEVAAVHGSANASLIAGYGYGGILIAFIARQNPLAVLPVAVLVGGIAASGGMLQRRLDLPDATVLVFQGLAFVTILASEALYGRLRVFQPPAGEGRAA